MGAGWLPPSEFWRMHPREWLWFLAAKKEALAPLREGVPEKTDYQELYRMLKEHVDK